jgi:RNA-directed DNA polymerase
MNVLSFPRKVPSPVSPLVQWQAELFRETRTAARPLRELMPRLLERRNLEAAWERVRSADGADTPGPDGVTCSALGARATAWLGTLAEDLFQRSYRPQPPRWFDVPKPGQPERTRRLGVLNVRDRVVQAALKQLLEPILEPLFLPTSFGFRPGRSVPGALAHAVATLAGAPFGWAAHLDVADCFDTVDHGLLREQLRGILGDEALLGLLDAVLAAGGTRTGRLWWQRTCGLVQGSALSPLLCNLALHPLDLALRELAADTQDGLCLLRYADDLLLLARDERVGKRGTQAIRQVLKKLRQEVREDKVQEGPLAAGIDWLGVRLVPRKQHWPGQQPCGYVVPDSRVAAMLARLEEMTTPPSERIDGTAFNPARWVVSINDQLRDWRGAYQFADNAPEVFRTLDEKAQERVGGLLQSLLSLNRFELFRQHRVKLPRGFSTWEVPGARLTVLSALAPVSPTGLVRRPAWMRYREPAPAAASRPAPLPLPGPTAAAGS